MKILTLIVLLSSAILAQQLPKVPREFRAAWIATVDNIDFPTKKGLSEEQQKQELIDAVKLAKELRLNALIFQVRPMTDAVYKSDIEPWSEYLTGEMGKPQNFDPLEFLVAEAHKNGILVHAWFNPYRSYHPSAKTMSDKHISKTHPEMVRQYGRYMWLDPTELSAQQHSLKVITDVVRRYDIDGIHFDDYFYPYAEKDAAGNKIEFPDDKNWNEYLQTAAKFNATSKVKRLTLSRDDWRRSQVNAFIEAVGRESKKIKPHIVYGISPFGIWQPMPDKKIQGFNSYAELYADSKKWLQDGTVDYLAPQLYWETARQGQSFPVLLDWWKSQNTKRRHIWPGIASYRIGSTPTFNADEIASQLNLTRKDELTLGGIHFSFKSLRRDMGGIQAKLRDEVYKENAVTPAFPWIRVARPASPKPRVEKMDEIVRITWSAQPRAFWYVVYAKDRNGWSRSVLSSSEMSIALSIDRAIEQIAVTSVDRLGNESTPRIVKVR